MIVLIATIIFHGKHSAPIIIPRTAPVIFTTLEIIAVASPCLDISGHKKTAIGIPVRKLLVFFSSDFECSGNNLECCQGKDPCPIVLWYRPPRLALLPK